MAHKGRRGTAAPPFSPPGLPLVITCSFSSQCFIWAERLRSPDGALCATYGETPCSLISLYEAFVAHKMYLKTAAPRKDCLERIGFAKFQEDPPLFRHF